MPNIQNCRIADVKFSGENGSRYNRLLPVLDFINLLLCKNGPVVFSPPFVPTVTGTHSLYCAVGNSERYGQIRQGFYWSGLLGQDFCDLFVCQFPRPVNKTQAHILSLSDPLKIAGRVVSRIAVLVVANMLCARRVSMKGIGNESVKGNPHASVTSGIALRRAFLSLEKHFAGFANFYRQGIHSLNIP